MLWDLPLWAFNSLFIISRWLHLVATTLLVGGVLFLEFVVPLATEDLHDDQRLAVFGKARYVFNRIVWGSAVVLLLTGLLSGWRMWDAWQLDQQILGGQSIKATLHPFWLIATPWFLAHAVLGVIGIILTLRVTSGRCLLHRPVGWMQAIMIILLVTIFLASVGRHVRLRLRDWHQGTQSYSKPGEV